MKQKKEQTAWALKNDKYDTYLRADWGGFETYRYRDDAAFACRRTSGYSVVRVKLVEVKP